MRLNITLDEKLNKTLMELCPEYEENKSQFIAKALRMMCDMRLRKKIDDLLTEAYKRTYNEDSAITKEFEAVDLEEWDEY